MRARFKLVRLQSAAAYYLRKPILDHMSVGRGLQNDLVVRDPVLSSAHARVEVRGEQLWVTDLKSRNGTEVDGKALVPDVGVVVQDGGEISFADRLRFRLEVVESAPDLVISLVEPEVQNEIGVMRVLALPDALNLHLESERLLALRKLELGVLRALAAAASPTTSLLQGMLALFGAGSALVRFDGDGFDVVGALELAGMGAQGRGIALRVCRRRGRSVVVDVAEAWDGEDGESSGRTMDSGVQAKVSSVLCGHGVVGGESWGAVVSERELSAMGTSYCAEELKVADLLAEFVGLLLGMSDGALWTG